MDTFYLNRRKFLKGSTGLLAMTAYAPSTLKTLFTDKTWKVGLIGSGWYGKSDLFRLIQVANVEVLAICDVDKNMLNEAAELVSKRQRSGKVPLKYNDYRKMLKEQEFDIVLIGSPDHWHALQAIEALKAGAHVFLQKPISVDVIEGEAILAAARKYQKVVQIGTQRRSTPHLVHAKMNVVEAGLLGKISYVDMCCYYHMRGNIKNEPQSVPSELDYEMWTGPAPLRPYNGNVHRRWRAYMEYCNGIVGDMCVHMFDATRWMLGLGYPQKISSTGGIYVQKESLANTTDTQHAVFEYPELQCVWNHRSWGSAPDPAYPWAFTIYGENGTLKGSVQKYEFIPTGEKEPSLSMNWLDESTKYPEDLTEKGIELFAASAMRNHMLDFLKAIEEGTKPIADIEEGHISSASCILANISCDLNRPLVYDPSKKIVVADAEATSKLQRPYRSPWQHPTLDNI
jgi:predicted dehydrogenase